VSPELHRHRFGETAHRELGGDVAVQPQPRNPSTDEMLMIDPCFAASSRNDRPHSPSTGGEVHNEHTAFHISSVYLSMAAMLPIPALFTSSTSTVPKLLDSRGDYGLPPSCPRSHRGVLVPHVIAKLRGEGATPSSSTRQRSPPGTSRTKLGRARHHAASTSGDDGHGIVQSGIGQSFYSDSFVRTLTMPGWWFDTA
jgi:hypothetical protein